MNFLSEIEKNIERAFRSWTERVFGPAASGELIVAHHAILEEIGRKVRTVARGQRVFPYNSVKVRLPAASGELLYARLDQDIREALTAAGCAMPAGFTVAFETGPFEVACENRTAPPARLEVVRGKALQSAYNLEKGRTNLGRLAELTDADGRVVRRNDVVFEEGADEANSTVSRSHAHIRREGLEYRVCDDGSQYGTRVFRDGRGIDVPPGNRRGERLRPGDEIYLGRACLRFEQ